MSDKALYEALLKIKNDPQLKPFVEWLESQREATRDRMETAQDAFQVEQGRALILKKILTCIEQAPDVLQKIK
jgi:hypothetical protein